MGTCECFNHTDVVPCAGGNTTSLISSCQQIADIKYTSRLTWPRCSYPAQVRLLEHPRVDKLTLLFRDQPPSTPSTTKNCPAGPLGHCPSTKNVPSFPAAVSAVSKTLAPPTHPNRRARYTSRQGRAAPPPNRTYSQPNVRPGAGAPCRSTVPSVWERAGRSAVEDSGGFVWRLSGTFRAARVSRCRGLMSCFLGLHCRRMRSDARGLTRGRYVCNAPGSPCCEGYNALISTEPEFDIGCMSG